ncbi:unnamed protein product [Brassica rapa]|uniref:DUF223 domain-containing protein n=2 Tax=Brassica TaxID=3705 RepID=A0A8D9MFJ2_BRACM|nr:unnamed protein product [Brassica napus]CAG7910208.1 unnamed protein product [Brassica rapa]
MVASATSLVFDDLKKGFNKNEVLARVVHFWEARNINKGGLLMGFELFLIDRKFLIQFTQQTVLAPTDHAGHDIKRQNFRIRSYAEFNEAVNKNEDLYGKNYTTVYIKIYMIL